MTPDDEGKMFAALAQRESNKTSQLDELHAYTQSLTISDIESCITVENEAFPENERCSREKVSPVCCPCPVSSLGHPARCGETVAAKGTPHLPLCPGLIPPG